MIRPESYAHILCYLAPIEPLLLDPAVSEIMVNADRSVYIECAGLLRNIKVAWGDEEYLDHALRTIARVLGQDISALSPTLDTRLPDGSRVAIAVPPISPEGPTLTIRKFQRSFFTLDNLIAMGSISESVGEKLRCIVCEERANLLISGGTGAGKTSLLNALVAEIPPHERLGILEDTREIQAAAPNRFQLEAHRDEPAITIRDLIKTSLRHRPDRLIIGEVRGPEAFDLVSALNTGHSGSMATLHANNAHLALARLTTLVLMEGAHWPLAAVKSSIADAVQYIAHIARRKDGSRGVSELVHVEGYDITTDSFRTVPCISSSPSRSKAYEPALSY